MNNFAMFMKKFIFAAAIWLLVWLMHSNIEGLQDHYHILGLSLASIAAGLIIVPTKVWRKLLANRQLIKKLLLAAVVLSILARFSFVFQKYSPSTDPKYFFESAHMIRQTGGLDAESVIYTATFPFLLAYQLLLSLFMSIFQYGVLAVIILNTLFDILSAFLICRLVSKISSRRAGLIGAVLWLVNPYNIIASVVALPTVVVNAAIFASLLAIYKMFANLDDTKKSLKIAAIVAACLSFGNAFRPFMVLFILAIVVFAGLNFLADKNKIKLKMKNFGLAFVVIIGGFLAINFAHYSAVSSFLGRPATTQAGGWNIFVGANADTSGTWNMNDWQHFQSILKTEGIDAAQIKVRNQAIERYRNLSPKQLFVFLTNKSTLLGGYQLNSYYNIDGYPDFWGKSRRNQIVVSLYAWLFFFGLAALAIYHLKHEFFKKQLEFSLFVAIIFLGMFAGLMLVEVSPRYFLPMFTFLTIMAALAVEKLIFAKKI